MLSKRILFVTDGGSGLLKALQERFGKKPVHQRCVLHKSWNVQRHMAKPCRKEAHRKLTTALEQTSYTDATQMLLALDAWLRTKTESAADSLLKAFEELLTCLRALHRQALHRLKVPARRRKTLMSTNSIESLCSLVRHRERNITRTRDSTMLQRWRGTVLLYCEKQCKRVKGCAGIAQVIATIEAEHVEQPSAPTKKPVLSAAEGVA